MNSSEHHEVSIGVGTANTIATFYIQKMLEKIGVLRLKKK